MKNPDSLTVYAFRFCSNDCMVIVQEQINKRQAYLEAKAKTKNDRGSKS